MFATTSSSSSVPQTWWKSWFGTRPAAPGVERRATRRERISFKAVVEGPHAPGLIQVSGVDIHEHGALLVSRQPWAPGSVLYVQLKSFRLVGFAVVRHCSLRKAGNYAVGVEFRGRLSHDVEGS
jgi:hypothetical protein